MSRQLGLGCVGSGGFFKRYHSTRMRLVIWQVATHIRSVWKVSSGTSVLPMAASMLTASKFTSEVTRGRVVVQLRMALPSLSLVQRGGVTWQVRSTLEEVAADRLVAGVEFRDPVE